MTPRCFFRGEGKNSYLQILQIVGYTIYMSKTEALNLDLRRAHTRLAGRRPKDNDYWEEDPPYYKPGEGGGYDWYFSELLKKENAGTFQEILAKRKSAGIPAHALDLFGGGYFITDLSTVDSITGVRLQDNSAELLRDITDQNNQLPAEESAKKRKYGNALDLLPKLLASPQWGIVEGNLYRPDTWKKLRTYQHAKGIPSFDLIVAKPDGAFADKEIFHVTDRGSDEVYDRYGRVFLRLLNNAYTVLSFNEGKLFSECPGFVSQQFLEPFQAVSEEAGIKVEVTDSMEYSKRKNIAITKYPHSTTDLEGTILKKYTG
jgi:hypothetical protein